MRARAEKEEEEEKKIPAAASPAPVYRVSPPPRPAAEKRERIDLPDLFPDVWPTLDEDAQAIAVEVVIEEGAEVSGSERVARAATGTIAAASVRDVELAQQF